MHYFKEKMHYYGLDNGQQTFFAVSKMHLKNTVPGVGPYVRVPRIFQAKLKNYWNNLKCLICGSISVGLFLTLP